MYTCSVTTSVYHIYLEMAEALSSRPFPFMGMFDLDEVPNSSDPVTQG